MKKNFFRYGKYGMRSSDYELMLSDQQGRCAICHKLPPEGERLCIDHDHNSEVGECRGLLCRECNTGLGMFYDNPVFLRAAAKYLEEGGAPSRFRVESGKLIVLRDELEFPTD